VGGYFIENSGKVVKLPEKEASEMKASNRSSSTPPKCIVVPLVLNMSDVDHEVKMIQHLFFSYQKTTRFCDLFNIWIFATTLLQLQAEV